MLTGLSYSELLKIIAKFIKEKKTGVLFLSTDDARSIFIIFHDGIINGVTCDAYRGRKAIEVIREVKSVFSCRLQIGKAPKVKQDLVSMHQTLIDFGFMDKQGKDGNGELNSFSDFNHDMALPPSFSRTHLDEFIREILIQAVMPYLGPAAFVLVEDVEENVGGLFKRNQLSLMVIALASELDDLDEQKQLVKKTNNVLDEVLGEHTKKLVCQKLNQVLGPIAKSLCEAQMKENANRLSDPIELEVFIESLATAINNEEQEQRFIRNVMSALSPFD